MFDRLSNSQGAALRLRPACVVMFTLIALGGCASDRPALPIADLVFFNANILEFTVVDPRSNALAVRDGIIVDVGSRETIEERVGPATRVFDLKGNTLVPGLADHHVHLLNMGFSLLNQGSSESLYLNLSGLSPLEIQKRIMEKASAVSPGTWILGKGWSQEAWGQTELPTHYVLTQAAPVNPVYLSRVDGHAGWVNLRALQLSGLTAQTPDPEGGAIARTKEGEPGGTLLERANELVLKNVPTPSAGDIQRAFRLACQAMAAQGVTEVFDAGFLQIPGVVALNLDLSRVLQLIKQSDLEEPLPLQINWMIPAPSELATQLLAEPEDFRLLTPRLKVTHLKLFADGAMGSRGAELSHPYHDDPSTHGIQRMGREEQYDLTVRALDAGLDVATHCIGDAAVTRTLDIYEQLLDRRSDLAPSRLRIEHFSYAAEEDFRRAADLGITLSIQPNFVVPNDEGATMEDKRVGILRSPRAYAWQRLHLLGARLAGGSDYFTQPEQPLLNFYAAVTRKNTDGRPETGWHPEERLDRKAALLLFTRLYTAGDRGVRPALLAAGQEAHLTILSADPLTVAEREILNIQVLGTVSSGRITHAGPVLTESR